MFRGCFTSTPEVIGDEKCLPGWDNLCLIAYFDFQSNRNVVVVVVKWLIGWEKKMVIGK